MSKKSMPMPQGFETVAKQPRGANSVVATIDDPHFTVIPEAFRNASASKTETVAKAARKAVTARIDMSADVAGAGLCPECRKPMERSHANGIPVLTCDMHRIAIPIPDEASNE